MEGESSHKDPLKWMSLSSGGSGNGNVSHEPEDDMKQEMIMAAGRSVNLTDPVSIQFPTTACVDFVPECSTFRPKSRYGDMLEGISSSVKGIHAADGISEVPKYVLYCNSAGKACVSKSTDFSLDMGPWKRLLHGTTIIIIQLGNAVLVGVDSRSTISTSSTGMVGGRQFPYSDSCKKLEEIKQGVVCTLCGDGARVKQMCKYLQRIASDGDFSSLAYDGQQYLIKSREHPHQAEAASYIVGWDKKLQCLYLGEEQSAWIVYMVTFASSQLGEEMYRSCSVVPRSTIVRWTVLNGDVHAFVGYASKELQLRAYNMHTPECLYDL